MIKNIVFFGSSRFSIPSLKAIIKAHKEEFINLRAIITSIDKPANRGYKLTLNPVAEIATENDFEDKIIKIENLKNEEILNKIKNIKADLGIVVSFGYIIPEELINYPRLGMINLHPGNLPFYRGAAPIQRTLQNNDKTLDINIINLTFQLDAGEILNKKTVEISQETSAKDFIPFLAEEGSKLLLETIINVEKFKEKQEKQIGEPSYAKKIKQEELLINFEEDVKIISRKIKAFNLDGCCYFIKDNKRIKIVDSGFEEFPHNEVFGVIKNNFIYCKNGALKPIIIQKEGKKPFILDENIKLPDII